MTVGLGLTVSVPELVVWIRLEDSSYTACTVCAAVPVFGVYVTEQELVNVDELPSGVNVQVVVLKRARSRTGLGPANGAGRIGLAANIGVGNRGNARARIPPW